MVNNKKSEKPTTTSYNATKTNTLANTTNQQLTSGDPYCDSCKSSGNYTYRKYRKPRPMKHYRLSYNDSVNGVTYKTGRGVNTVASMERPGGLTMDTTSNISSSDSSCNGCGKITDTEWKQNNKCCDTKVHITRSANTVIPRVKNTRVMSNRERLRQRALTYKQNQTKNLVIYLVLLSFILEIFHLFIPERSFQLSDLFGNFLGVVVVIFVRKLINKYAVSKK